MNTLPKEIRRIFLEPAVTDEYTLSWSEPNTEKVIKILCDHHQFSKDRVEPTLQKYASITHMMKQKTLF